MTSASLKKLIAAEKQLQKTWTAYKKFCSNKKIPCVFCKHSNRIRETECYQLSYYDNEAYDGGHKIYPELAFVCNKCGASNRLVFKMEKRHESANAFNRFYIPLFKRHDIYTVEEFNKRSSKMVNTRSAGKLNTYVADRYDSFMEYEDDR